MEDFKYLTCTTRALNRISQNRRGQWKIQLVINCDVPTGLTSWTFHFGQKMVDLTLAISKLYLHCVNCDKSYCGCLQVFWHTKQTGNTSSNTRSETCRFLVVGALACPKASSHQSQTGFHGESPHFCELKEFPELQLHRHRQVNQTFTGARFILEDCLRWAKPDRPTFNFGRGAISSGACSEGAIIYAVSFGFSAGGQDRMPFGSQK